MNSELILKFQELLRNRTYGKTLDERIYNAYTQLQTQVNALYDQDAIPNNNLVGLRQVLEKKQVGVVWFRCSTLVIV